MPVSCCRISCVLRAIRAEKSVKNIFTIQDYCLPCCSCSCCRVSGVISAEKSGPREGRSANSSKQQAAELIASPRLRSKQALRFPPPCHPSLLPLRPPPPPSPVGSAIASSNEFVCSDCAPRRWVAGGRAGGRAGVKARRWEEGREGGWMSGRQGGREAGRQGGRKGAARRGKVTVRLVECLHLYLATCATFI